MTAREAAHGGYLERAEVTNARTIDLVEYEHRARYLWAAELVPERGVLLDAACGTGHGSEVLAGRGSVIGIDIAKEAVDRARSRAQGTFIQSALPPVPLGVDAVDAVISFETIEHIEDDEDLIDEFSRVLRPGGTLFISSPNSKVTSPDGEVGNQFHVREYTLEELTTLVTGHGFEVEGVFGQGRRTSGPMHRLVRSGMWRTRALGRFSGFWRRLIFDRVMDRAVSPAAVDEAPEYWILRCRQCR